MAFFAVSFALCVSFLDLFLSLDHWQGHATCRDGNGNQRYCLHLYGQLFFLFCINSLFFMYSI